MGSPVTERNGIITNQPATFVKPGPTSTERYSKVTDDGGKKYCNILYVLYNNLVVILKYRKTRLDCH